MTQQCYYCGGRVLPQRVRHVHPWDGTVVIFDDVPAEVCQQCGEVYFSPDTVELFDTIVREGGEPASVISVPVFSLAALTAA